MRGELDWIVMKALEKDRNRRYETANGFAADVQRYLADEPVQACPPSVGYRLRKFARRNKPAFVMATALSLAVLLAAGSFGWGMRDRARQDKAAQQAKESLARARSWLGEDKVALARQELAETKRRFVNDLVVHHSLVDEVEALDSELEKLERFLGLTDRADAEGIPLAISLEGERFRPSGEALLLLQPRETPSLSCFRLQALSCYEVMERSDWKRCAGAGAPRVRASHKNPSQSLRATHHPR